MVLAYSIVSLQYLRKEKESVIRDGIDYLCVCGGLIDRSEQKSEE